MGIKKLFFLESETVTDNAIEIPFEFSNKESIPEGKNVGQSIVMSPITVRTWFKIRPLILSIEQEDFNKLIEKEKETKTPDAELIETMAKYDELLLDIVTIGIHNKKSNPPKWFRDVLKDNCTWKDIYVLLNAILFRIYYNPFCNSITMLKNVSPLTEAEIIAAQKNLESWTSDQLAQ